MSTQFFTGMAAANRGFDAGVERTRQAYDNRRATQQTYNIRQAEFDDSQEQRRQAAGLAQADLDFAAGVDPFVGIQPGQTVGDTTAPIVGLQPPKRVGSALPDNGVSAELQPLWEQLESTNNLPTGFMRRLAEVESSLGTNLVNPNSSARGIFQFLSATAKEFGIDPMDARQSSEAAAALAKRNARQLTSALGRQPTAGELYLAHQQGGGGAARLLANPNALAADVVGKNAIRLNGGDPDTMTAGEFAQLWISKFEGGQTAPRTQGQAQQTAQVGGLTPSQMFGQIVAPSEIRDGEGEPGMTITVSREIFGMPELDQWPVVSERPNYQSRNDFAFMRNRERDAIGSAFRRFDKEELRGLTGLLGPTGLLRRSALSEMDYINMGFTGEAEAREIEQAIGGMRGKIVSGPVGKYFLERPGLIQEFEKLPREQKIQVIRNILADSKPVDDQIKQGTISGKAVVDEIVERTKQAGITSPDRAPKELQQEPSSKLSRVYLDNPEMPTAHQQRAMQQRERLVAYIQSLQRVGGPQAAAAAMQARMQVDQIDERLYYLEGMKAINQFRDFGDPRLLSGVWSHYSGQQVDVAPTPAGNYDIIVNGQPYAQAVDNQSIISTVELLFNEEAQQRLRAMQAMRAEMAIKFENMALEEQVKLGADLQRELTKGNIKMALNLAENAGIKLHNDGANNVFAVVTDPYGRDKIYLVTNNGFEQAGGTRIPIPPTLTEIRFGQTPR